MLQLVAQLNRRGPTVLAFGIVLGLAWPAAADLARPAMAATVFFFVLGTLLRVEARALAQTIRRPAVTMALPFMVMVAAPLLAAAGVSLAGLEPELGLALVLAVAAPPTSTTTAVARMLGFDGAVPLVATLVSIALAPFTVPLLADWFGGAPIGALDLAGRLTALVGSAGVAALLLRRFAGDLLVRRGDVVDALTVAALLIYSLANMAGVRERIEAEPWLAAGCIALAYGTNLAFQALGVAVFPGDLPNRMIIGLTLGNKNVGLVWAALGSQVSPLMGLYFAATQLPIFTLPRLAQALLHVHRNAGLPPAHARSKP